MTVLHSYGFVDGSPMDIKTAVHNDIHSPAVYARILENSIASKGHDVNSHVYTRTLVGETISVFFLVDVADFDKTMWHLITEPTEQWAL